jgi:hypothetical protein
MMSFAAASIPAPKMPPTPNTQQPKKREKKDIGTF